MTDKTDNDALVRLADCPPGLFKFGDNFGFMTEYSTKIQSTGQYQRDAYVVASGEYFWGGASTSEGRSNLLVLPIEVDSLTALRSPAPVVETFTATVGVRRKEQKISGINELLRLINGGAVFGQITRDEAAPVVDRQTMALAQAATDLVTATDGKEELRPQRQAVLDALISVSEATRPQPAQDEVELYAAAIFEADPDVGVSWAEWVRYADEHPDHQQSVDFVRRQARAITALRQHGDIAAITEPWADFHGDLPDYDHPMRPVYESGIQYAVDLLAKVLNVEEYDVCDGTEEFDGDLGGTMFNIVLAAMPKDKDGDPIHPDELRQHGGESDETETLRAEVERLRELVRAASKWIGKKQHSKEGQALFERLSQALKGTDHGRG